MATPEMGIRMLIELLLDLLKAGYFRDLPVFGAKL